MTATRWLVVLLVVTNMSWAYAILDRSVTMQHQAAELARLRSSADLLASLVGRVNLGSTKAEVLSFLSQEMPDVPSKEHGDTIEVGPLLLLFRDGRYVRSLAL